MTNKTKKTVPRPFADVELSGSDVELSDWHPEEIQREEIQREEIQRRESDTKEIGDFMIIIIVNLFYKYS